MVVLSYVNGVTERISRVLKSYDVAAAVVHKIPSEMNFVHPKDKRYQLNTTHAIYGAPYRNCDLDYIGETGRTLGSRLEEHKSEVEKVSNKIATRAGRKESLTNTYKSAITDHVADKNHVIGWEQTKVIGTEEDIYKQRTETMDSIISLTFLMSFWYQRDQDHRLENTLATLLLHRIVASPDTNTSHLSSVDKDGSLR